MSKKDGGFVVMAVLFGGLPPLFFGFLADDITLSFQKSQQLFSSFLNGWKVKGVPVNKKFRCARFNGVENRPIQIATNSHKSVKPVDGKELAQEFFSLGRNLRVVVLFLIVAECTGFSHRVNV